MATCLIFVLVVMVILIVLLASSPALPKLTLSSFTVNNFTLTGDHISGYLNIQLQALNPNMHTDFSYDDLFCSVYHDKQHLASTVSSGFVQKHRETTPINVTIFLTQGTTAGGDLATSGLVEFDVKLTTIIKWRSWWFAYVSFSCDDVAVGGLLPETGGRGKMIGQARKCKV